MRNIRPGGNNMKKTWLCVVLFAVALLIGVVTSVQAAGPVTFNENTVSITYDNATGAYFMVMPAIDIAGQSYWAKWRANLNTRGWELVGGGLSSSALGQQSASGKWLYDPSKGVLYIRTDQSSFVGDCAGAWIGRFMAYANVTSTTLTITDFDDVFDGGQPDTNEWTRLSGAGTDIVGSWGQNGSDFILSVNPDNTFTLSGTVTE